MANLYSYVPSQVKVSVFGIDLVGLAKDSFISIERIDNLVSFRKAQDGTLQLRSKLRSDRLRKATGLFCFSS